MTSTSANAAAEHAAAKNASSKHGAAGPLSLLPGLLVTAVGTVTAILVAQALPAVSALTVAVLLGALVGNLSVLPDATRPGLAWATRRLLRIGVVLLGLQLAVPQLFGLGAYTLLMVLLTVAVTFGGTVALGRLLGLPHELSLLVGTGFSICGAAAVAAVEGVVRRDRKDGGDQEGGDAATAVALVTLFGTAVMLVLPLLAGPLAMTGTDFGRWAGASVHEIAQVVAAAAPAGAAAVTTAVVVKLSRVVLLAPLVAGISVARRRHDRSVSGRRPPLVPLFVLGFLATVTVRSSGVLPGGVLDLAKSVTTLLLAGALFGLGSAVRIGALVRTGPKALLLGLLSTMLAVTTSYVGIVLAS